MLSLRDSIPSFRDGTVLSMFLLVSKNSIGTVNCAVLSGQHKNLCYKCISLNYYPNSNHTHYQRSQCRLLSTTITLRWVSIKIRVSMIKKLMKLLKFLCCPLRQHKNFNNFINFFYHPNPILIRNLQHRVIFAPWSSYPNCIEC